MANVNGEPSAVLSGSDAEGMADTASAEVLRLFLGCVTVRLYCLCFFFSLPETDIKTERLTDNW